MYPPSKPDARALHEDTEHAISTLAHYCMDLWLPLVESAVLAAAPPEPPADPSAVEDVDSQWQYLVDAVLVYALAVIAADAMRTAYSSLTTIPMRTADAVKDLVLVDIGDPPKGLPSRDVLTVKVRSTLRRELNIDTDAVLNAVRTTPALRVFAEQIVTDQRGQVIDIVGRVMSRLSRDATNAAVRKDLDSDAWDGAVSELSRTHATSVLNSATETAATTAQDRDKNIRIQVTWTAIHDNHTREAHRHADGQTVPLGSTFTVGGEQLRFPGDPLGSPEQTANCRCALFASVTGRTASAVDELTAEVDEFKNWVDECGGLPKYIKRIAKHVQEKGATESQAIATAVNAAKKMCSTGDVNLPGKQNVNAGSRAEACAAVTEWEKLKACAARKRAKNASATVKMADTVTEGGTTMAEYRSFTSVLAVIGTPTDDGRMFAEDIALSYRDFPLPLAWQKMSDAGHMSSYTVGVIQSAEIVGTEVVGTGYMLNTPEAQQALGEIEHGVTGPSVDLGDASWELRDASGKALTVEDLHSLPMDAKVTEVVLSAKLLGATLVSIPAFGQTSITLGAMVDVETNQPALVAAAAAQEATRRYSPPVYPAAYFTDPGFEEPTHPHITDGGRIQGHMALWNTCHIGVSKSCETPPMSLTDYAWFHTSPPVKTDDDGVAKVGRLTVATGHADTSLNIGPAVAHYDNTGTCFALVHVGEDEHGIWFSGVPAPGVTDEQLTAGLSAPLSGDWRWVAGNYELVAALSVNVPGYGIVASGATDEHGDPKALIASLGPCHDDAPLTRADISALAAQVVAEMRAAERRNARASAIMGEYNARRARALFNRIGGQ